MADERVQCRLAAILAADVVGYSRLMGEDEAATRARFNEQLDEVVRPAIDEHRGRVVKTMGGGNPYRTSMHRPAPGDVRRFRGG